MVGGNSGEFTIRQADADDEPGILALARASRGWLDDAVHNDYFRWKHRENPFGSSPMWVAVDGDRLAGFRTFLRWQFDTPEGVVHAVRAVDTATSPDYQGRGVFTKLTLHALDELRTEGVDFVFNTPNAQSLPGYLKMGWQVVGRVPVSVRPRSPFALATMARSRVPADRWSIVTEAGVAAPEVLADAGVDALLASQPPATCLRTRRTAAHLRWRYAYPPLSYRCVLAGSRVEDGLAVFRLRPRGDATEAVLCDVLAHDGDPASVATLSRSVAEVSAADYVIKIGAAPLSRPGFVRLPAQGPLLTCRSVCTPAATEMSGWALRMGDVELL